jgi:serine/threonine-protein kinase
MATFLDSMVLEAAGRRRPDDGRYEIVRPLSSGGMGKVFLARTLGVAGFSKLVAIKRLHADLATDPRVVGRFIDEAKIAARLDHPNIVQVFDFARAEDGYFLVMEYVHGISFSDLLQRSSQLAQPLPVDVSLGLIVAACHGLGHAHELCDEDGRPLGIVHRDVSPANLLLSVDGSVKVADFGIARAVERRTKTMTGLVVGKLSYMSPEQMSGGVVDRRTDIYALGVVLHELLVGRRLFSAARSNSGGRPRPERPSFLNPLVPPDVDEIVLRALHEDPEQRFAACEQLAGRLSAAMLRHGMMSSARRRARLVRAWFPALATPLEPSSTDRIATQRARRAPDLHTADTVTFGALAAPAPVPLALPLPPPAALTTLRPVLAWTARSPRTARPFADLAARVPWPAVVAATIAFVLAVVLAAKTVSA